MLLDKRGDKVKAEALRRNPANFTKFKLSELRSDIAERLRKYEPVGIAYEFELNILENNNHGVTAGFFDTVRGGSNALGLSAGLDRQRQNTRNFIVTDTFKDLIVTVDEKYCPLVPIDKRRDDKNYFYPLFGDVGMLEFVHTYIKMNEDVTLKAKDKDGVPTFSDQLDFQTKLTGSVSPTLTFGPTPRDFALINAGMTNVATRTDNHRVRVAVSMPLPPTATAPIVRATEKGPKVTPQAATKGLSGVDAAVLELQRQQDRFLSNTLRELSTRGQSLQ